MDLKLPSWELAKELADRMPGGKGETKDDPKCENCGAPVGDPYEQRDKKASW